MLTTFLCGRVRYADAWQWQKRIMKARLGGDDPRDVLMLLEHDPVFTIGRSGKTNPQHLARARANGVDVQRIERGGQITYHGPGQLVGYPMLDLRRYRQDLHWYVRQLEEVLLRVLRRHGVHGRRHESHTGVWVGSEKLAAIGINCSRWFTMHGFALNVKTEATDAFSRIVPCGIEEPGLGVGSLESLLQRHVCLDEVRQQVLEEFQEVFEVECLVQPLAPTPVLADIVGLSPDVRPTPIPQEAPT